MNDYNNSYRGYRGGQNGLGALSKALVFIVLLVAVLSGVAVLGLMRDPIEEAQAAGMMVGVDRQAADLVADIPQMPAISAAEASAQIAQINSEAQTRAVSDDVTRRSIVHAQEYREAVDAEELDFSQDMHQIAKSLALGGGVALLTLVSLGAGWAYFKEINSRMTVRVAIRAAEAAEAQLAAAQAVASAQAASAQAAAVPPVVSPAPLRSTPRAEPITGRLPDLPTGRPRRERPTQPQPAQPQPAALAVTSIPPHRWLETIGHGNGAYPNGNGHSLNGNGHSLNGNGHSSNGNGHNGRHG